MLMGTGTKVTYYLPEGWTVRKVATAIAREWLPPFRAEPAVKGARWVVQPVVEETGKTDPLWEPGISTHEYEERLDKAECWSIRASAGRGKNTILARLVKTKGQPMGFHMECQPVPLPESLFDAEKLDEFLRNQGVAGPEGLFAGLLASHGFEQATN